MKQKKLWKRLIAVGACSAMMFAMPVGVFAAESETATSGSVSETKASDYGSLIIGSNMKKYDDGSVAYEVYIEDETTTTGYSIELSDRPIVMIDGVPVESQNSNVYCSFIIDSEAAKSAHTITVTFPGVVVYDEESQTYVEITDKSTTIKYTPDGSTEGGADSGEKVDVGSPRLSVILHDNEDGTVTYQVDFPMSANDKGYIFTPHEVLGVTVDGQPYPESNMSDPSLLNFDREFLSKPHDVVISYKLDAFNYNEGHRDVIEYDFAFKTEVLSSDDGDESDDENNQPIIVTPENKPVTKDEMQELVNSNQTSDVLVKTSEGVVFTFAKGTMQMVEGKDSYDMGVELIKDYTSLKDASFAEDEFAVRVNFNYDGKLPGTAKISIPVGAKWIGKTLYYYEVLSDGTLKYTGQNAVVDEDGMYTISQSHCSDYVALTKAPKADGENNAENKAENNVENVAKSPKTGDPVSVAGLIGGMLVSMGGIGTVVYKKRK